MKECSQFTGHTMFSQQWNSHNGITLPPCINDTYVFTLIPFIRRNVYCVSSFAATPLYIESGEVAGRHNLHFYKLNYYGKKKHIQEIQKEHYNTKKLRNFEMRSETGRGGGVHFM